MKTFRAVACASVAAAAFFCGADAAQAGPKGLKIGLGLKHHHQHQHQHGLLFHGHGHLHGHGHVWHDTSHYDYHPGQWVWNGFRWVYVPGHYDLHVDGHWDHLHH